ncbi:MAG: undecaprenyl/decaprenyl-phosphate alpha-N-acetylglucosaminyl 1-phosphate transferase [Firmicutes bacterium]|nr:undecaprenyl/decaprenyl-phosphate alpha-N-acetylglucosaminyl 1-phosphate transferase [Bacillota bacterium]
MEHDWILYLAAFFSSFAVSLLATPFAKKVSYRLGAIDYPKSRGLNKEPMPRMGGLAMVLGFAFTLALLSIFLPELRTKQVLGFFAGGIVIVFLGMIDDVYELSAKFKFCVQIFVACIVVFSGTKINVIMWPMWEYLRPFSSIITIFWIIGLINAVNLIDGVDGLAAGVTSIASLCLMILCIISGTSIAVVFTAALAGASLGFLPRNFSPAEIYMGDTGSTFLGYVLAVSSCIGVYKSYALLSIIIAVLAMALPILDTLFAMIRRAANGKPIMQADRGHLHHRLIDNGYSHKQTVIILYTLSILSGTIAILIAIKDFRATIVVLLSVLIIAMIFYVYKLRIEKAAQAEEDEDDDD